MITAASGIGPVEMKLVRVDEETRIDSIIERMWGGDGQKMKLRCIDSVELNTTKNLDSSLADN